MNAYYNPRNSIVSLNKAPDTSLNKPNNDVSEISERLFENEKKALSSYIRSENCVVTLTKNSFTFIINK